MVSINCDDFMCLIMFLLIISSLLLKYAYTLANTCLVRWLL